MELLFKKKKKKSLVLLIFFQTPGSVTKTVSEGFALATSKWSLQDLSELQRTDVLSNYFFLTGLKSLK